MRVAKPETVDKPEVQVGLDTAMQADKDEINLVDFFNDATTPLSLTTLSLSALRQTSSATTVAVMTGTYRSERRSRMPWRVALILDRSSHKYDQMIMRTKAMIEFEIEQWRNLHKVSKHLDF